MHIRTYFLLLPSAYANISSFIFTFPSLAQRRDLMCVGLCACVSSCTFFLLDKHFPVCSSFENAAFRCCYLVMLFKWNLEQKSTLISEFFITYKIVRWQKKGKHPSWFKLEWQQWICALPSRYRVQMQRFICYTTLDTNMIWCMKIYT